MVVFIFFFFFSSRRRHTRCLSDWSSDVCSSDLTSPGVTGDVVIGQDPANAAGPSTRDGCSALTNDLTGRIALLDRGTCGFAVKVKNAQNAGAIAVLIADNVAGRPPGLMTGVDPTITIPSVRISLA